MSNKQITAEVMDITPAIAEEWLATNLENQRAIGLGRVERYREEMIAGNWLVTGESLIFDRDGRLLNGQHRLTAAIAAKATLKSQVVVRGVERDSFRAMDTGAPRLAADVLTIGGHGNGQQRFVKTLAAVAVYGIRYSSKVSPATSGAPKDGKRTASSQPSHAEILAFVEKNPTAKNSTKQVMDMQGFRQGLLPSSIMAWAHYQTRKISTELADEYLNSIMTGQNLKPKDPFLVIRELLIENQSATRKYRKPDLMAGVVKAWNIRRDGEKVNKPSVIFAKDWDTFPRFR